MKLLKITGFLPSSASSIEHATAVQLKQLIDDIAAASSTTVSFFDVSDGQAVVGLADDKKLGQLATEFSQETDVTVSEISLVSFQREQNRLRQQKIDRMKETRSAKK